ncbi:MAG: methyl-accepting chemotaxis protein, partial [Pseudomonadota bacterium]
MSALEEIALDLKAEHASAAALEEPSSRPQNRLSAWFARLSIGRKVQVFFGANLAFAVLAGLFVIAGYMQLGERTKTINLKHDYALASEQLLVNLSEAQRHAEVLIARGDNSRRRAALEQLRSADLKSEQLRAMVIDTNMIAFDRIELVQEGIADFRRQVAAFDSSRGDGARQESQASEVTATGDEVLEAGRELAEQLSKDADAMSASGTALISTLLFIWIGLAAVLVILTLVAQRHFDRTVGDMLKEMAAQMTKLASGRKDVTIPGRSRTDEIGEMARAMEVFHSAGVRLEKLSRERAARAKAELDEQTKLQMQQEEARLERDRVLREFADRFERTVGDVMSGVAEASSQLQTTSRMMANTADETSRRTSDVTQAMEEANTGATAAASASDEFAMSIGEISRQAASSAELAREATLSATQADDTISQLSASAQQVGQIVELIQTIAQRTNLLAL